MKCPRCGHPILPGSKFCGHCGYRLQTAAPQNANVPPTRPIDRPIPPRERPQLPPRRPHGIWGIVLVIVVLLVLVAGGYYGYQHFFASPSQSEQTSQNNNASNSGSSSDNTSGNGGQSNNAGSGGQISKNDATTGLHTMWSCVQNAVNHGQEKGPNGMQLSDLFENGSDNHDYKTLSEWANDQNHADKLKHLKVEAQVKSIHSDGNGHSIVKYEVNYAFDLGDHTHYQGFNWTAKIKHSHGRYEFVTNKANNKPVYDHN